MSFTGPQSNLLRVAILGLSVAGCGASSGAARGDDPNDSIPLIAGAKAAENKPVPPSTTWFWQLSKAEKLDIARPSMLYDIDLYDVPPATISALKKAGKIVICYFNAGAFETWRLDAISRTIDAHDASVVGNRYAGYADELWLNTMSPKVRELASKRMDLAVAKGCDGVEPDNIDGFESVTGFPLTREDGIAFDRFLAAEAHVRNLSIGLKNSSELVDTLVGDFDWALAEECFESEECDAFVPFVLAGKAAFVAEYTATKPAWCASAASKKLQLAYFTKALDGTVIYCAP